MIDPVAELRAARQQIQQIAAERDRFRSELCHVQIAMHAQTQTLQKELDEARRAALTILGAYEGGHLVDDEVVRMVRGYDRVVDGWKRIQQLADHHATSRWERVEASMRSEPNANGDVLLIADWRDKFLAILPGEQRLCRFQQADDRVITRPVLRDEAGQLFIGLPGDRRPLEAGDAALLIEVRPKLSAPTMEELNVRHNIMPPIIMSSVPETARTDWAGPRYEMEEMMRKIDEQIVDDLEAAAQVWADNPSEAQPSALSADVRAQLLASAAHWEQQAAWVEQDARIGYWQDGRSNCISAKDLVQLFRAIAALRRAQATEGKEDDR